MYLLYMFAFLHDFCNILVDFAVTLVNVNKMLFKKLPIFSVPENRSLGEELKNGYVVDFIL